MIYPIYPWKMVIYHGFKIGKISPRNGGLHRRIIRIEDFPTKHVWVWWLEGNKVGDVYHISFSLMVSGRCQPRPIARNWSMKSTNPMNRLQPIYLLVPLHVPTITGSHCFFPPRFLGVPVDIPCVQFSEILPVEAQLLALGLQPAALLAAKR